MKPDIDRETNNNEKNEVLKKMFCPNCDSVLVISRDKKTAGKLKCLDCNYVEDAEDKLDEFVIREDISHNEKSKIEIVEFNEGEGITQEIREELKEQFREAIENFNL